MKLKLIKNGIPKKVKTGYSWKYLFFGVMYTMYRGDFKGLIMQLLLGACTGGLAFLIFPFTYNKAHIKRLMEKGYKPANEDSSEWLRHHLAYDSDDFTGI
tara:strand:- start:33 stop:332 length:300 start_codon:yes stop_codon:yes gene_type:complete